MPVISRTGRFPTSASGAVGEGDVEAVGEFGLQHGVVVLGRGHLRREQHPPVQGEPAPVEGLHLVRHRDMGVQVRVPGAGVAVGEPRRHQAASPALAGPRRGPPG